MNKQLEVYAFFMYVTPMKTSNSCLCFKQIVYRNKVLVFLQNILNDKKSSANCMLSLIVYDLVFHALNIFTPKNSSPTL